MSARSRKQIELNEHVAAMIQCRRCPRMQSTPVSGAAVVSDVMLIGQAPGTHEPFLQKPFAYTAGKTLFRWLEESCGMNEPTVRSAIYFAAVCRCFPGKGGGGTDRVPDSIEIGNCSWWMSDEFEILRPRLVIPVGKLAIAQFVPFEKLDDVVGKKFALDLDGHRFDLIPLPHPSGASPWHKIPPGKQLLEKAMREIARHPAIHALQAEKQLSLSPQSSQR
jgi:uracil-DNA glycosylase